MPLPFSFFQLKTSSYVEHLVDFKLLYITVKTGLKISQNKNKPNYSAVQFAGLIPLISVEIISLISIEVVSKETLISRQTAIFYRETAGFFLLFQLSWTNSLQRETGREYVSFLFNCCFHMQCTSNADPNRMVLERERGEDMNFRKIQNNY